MASKDSSECSVSVTIELGHQASFLSVPSPEGFTHDWTVFVRGSEGSRLEYFVEKVIFRLHETFKDPVRALSESPFKVSECGYAGFILPIELYFKNKQPPKRIMFEYDLFLNAPGASPINNVRLEKLRFKNPTPEFKAKLLKAGGKVIEGSDVQGVSSHLSEKREKKRGPKPKHDKDPKMEKVKKKKKKSESLSSLSSLSDEDEDERPV